MRPDEDQSRQQLSRSGPATIQPISRDVAPAPSAGPTFSEFTRPDQPVAAPSPEPTPPPTSPDPYERPATPPPAPQPQPLAPPTPPVMPAPEPLQPQTPAAPVVPPANPIYPQPQSTVPPVFSATPAAQPPHKESADASLIVLQWLTYAFWGWAVLSLSTLTTMVLSSFITKADTGSFTPYAIAAVLVLLPIAFGCDYFYSKKEPEKKTGPENIVMIIHAVIFALCAIGSLILAVFFLVQIFTSSSADNSGAQVGLYSSLIIAVYYVLTFLRTLNPAKLPWIQRSYKFIMLITIGIIAILGVVGPVAAERSTRNDRLIDDGLPRLTNTINDYAEDNKKLPASLSDVKTTGEAQKLIDDNLVQYKAVDTGQISATQATGANRSLSARGSSAFRYELCVTYKEKSRSYDKYNSTSRYSDSEGYTEYINSSAHPAGNVCYKLKAVVYDSSIN